MQKLFDFMMDRFGGEHTAKNEFVRHKLATLDIMNMTARDLFSKAEQDGWLHLLRDLTIDQFQEIVVPPEDEENEFADRSYIEELKNRTLRKRRGVSMEAAPSTLNLHPKPYNPVDHIVDFLRDHPWSSDTDIVEAVTLPQTPWTGT